MRTAADHPTTSALARRVRGEFMEMPGLQLDVPQAQRLWGLDAASCQAVLESLVETGVLARTRRAYALRRSEP
jgi:hypothetical protein